MLVVLEKQCLKKLRIILQSNYFYLFLMLFVAILLYFNACDKSKYDINDDVIIGTITSYYIDTDKLVITIFGKEKVLCNYYFKDENNTFDYELGDKIKLFGKLKLPSNNSIFNGFNYREYLKYERINYIFDIDEIIKISNNKSIMYKLKNSIINIINKSPNKDYLHTFLLGNNKYIDKEVMESYRINGISHLFSISGMHISLLSMIILKLLKNYKFKKEVVILFLLIYMTLTDFLPSILRSGIFFILIYLNKKFNLNISMFKLMIILLFICVLIDPYIVYKIGFQYSYTISFYLITFNQLINKSKNKLYKLFIVSFISFIVSVPIAINNFSQINVLSIFLNIFFVPIVSSIIFPLSLITFLFPFFNNLFTILINIFELLSITFSKIDNFIFIMSKISTLFIIIYYIIISITLYFLSKNKYKYIVSLMFIFVIHYNITIFNKGLEITYIDVGQGDSIFIKFPNDKSNILIDTGGKVTYGNLKNNYSVGKNIVDYLKSMGIRKLDYLIITHGDFDHMGDGLYLIDKFKVENVIFNCGEFNVLEKELIKVLDEKKIKYYSCIKELNIDNNKLYFLQTKKYDNENDNSNVIYTELNGYKFMFMGDAGVEKEKDILDKYNLANIDVLKVGHHGSKTSSSKEYIDEIKPKYAIISVGKNNRYGHPNKEVLNNLDNSKIYRTDQDGSIMFKIKNNKLKIETCSP
mgnify:FL=1